MTNAKPKRRLARWFGRGIETHIALPAFAWLRRSGWLAAGPADRTPS